jgi:hypothetical protein
VTTPNAAPIDTRFISAAVSGITSDRNASMSRRKLRPTTTPIVITSLLLIADARST